MANFSSEESKMARRLNLPPSYLMIHRVTFGSIGVLCQLDATAPFREIVTRACRVSPTRTDRSGVRRLRTGAGSPPLLVEFGLDGPQVLSRAPIADPAPTAPRVGLEHPGHRRLGDRACRTSSS